MARVEPIMTKKNFRPSFVNSLTAEYTDKIVHFSEFQMPRVFKAKSGHIPTFGLILKYTECQEFECSFAVSVKFGTEQTQFQLMAEKIGWMRNFLHRKTDVSLRFTLSPLETKSSRNAQKVGNFAKFNYLSRKIKFGCLR